MKKLKKKKMILLILCLGFAVLFINLLKENDEVLPKDKETWQDIDGNKELGELETAETDIPTPQPVRCKMSNSVQFENAQSMGAYKIVNSTDNEGLILQVTITDEANGNLLYISPALKPGEKVEKDKLLNTDYKAGNYPAIAKISSYKEETGDLYAEVSFSININILN